MDAFKAVKFADTVFALEALLINQNVMRERDLVLRKFPAIFHVRKGRCCHIHRCKETFLFCGLALTSQHKTCFSNRIPLLGCKVDLSFLHDQRTSKNQMKVSDLTRMR